MTVPFVMYCHPSLTAMIDAIMKSFGQHISVTFEPNEQLTIYVMENEEENTMSVLGERDASTCLILSGNNVQHFEKPSVMPPRDKGVGEEI